MNQQLLKQYQQMHKNPKRFPGNSTKRYIPEIAKLVKEYDAETLLDYGSGKGMQYLNSRIHDQWGGILPTCYDPGYAPLARRPGIMFDGVICTDVMEHIEEFDVDEVLKDIFSFADSFVFLGIATFLASKKLPDGRNCHLTIRPPEWWNHTVRKAASKPYMIKYETEGKFRDN